MITDKTTMALKLTRLVGMASLALAITLLASLSALGQVSRVQSLPGMSAEGIREAKQRLAELGYWTGPDDGTFDSATRHALVAFQKVERRTRTGKLTPDEVVALQAAKRPVPIESGYFHIEVDLSRQVLFVVDGSGVSKILPVSSGSGKLFTSEGWARRAITPTGRFQVSRKIAGWHKSPLGLLYYPVYFLNGIAIHGNPSVPMVPASHGCIRIPMFAAKPLSEMIPIGTVVLVHDGSAINPGSDTP